MILKNKDYWKSSLRKLSNLRWNHYSHCFMFLCDFLLDCNLKGMMMNGRETISIDPFILNGRISPHRVQGAWVWCVVAMNLLIHSILNIFIRHMYIFFQFHLLSSWSFFSFQEALLWCHLWTLLFFSIIGVELLPFVIAWSRYLLDAELVLSSWLRDSRLFDRFSCILHNIDSCILLCW